MCSLPWPSPTPSCGVHFPQDLGPTVRHLCQARTQDPTHQRRQAPLYQMAAVCWRSRRSLESPPVFRMRFHSTQCFKLPLHTESTPHQLPIRQLSGPPSFFHQVFSIIFQRFSLDFGTVLFLISLLFIVHNLHPTGLP